MASGVQVQLDAQIKTKGDTVEAHFRPNVKDSLPELLNSTSTMNFSFHSMRIWKDFHQLICEFSHDKRKKYKS